MTKQELSDLIKQNINKFKYTKSRGGWTEALYFEIGDTRFYATFTPIQTKFNIEKIGFLWCTPIAYFSEQELLEMGVLGLLQTKLDEYLNKKFTDLKIN